MAHRCVRSTRVLTRYSTRPRFCTAGELGHIHRVTPTEISWGVELLSISIAMYRRSDGLCGVGVEERTFLLSGVFLLRFFSIIGCAFRDREASHGFD